MTDHFAAPASGGAGAELFSALEASVERLAERHGAARRSAEALRAELQARDAQIADLSERVRVLEELRDEAVRRVDGLLERIQAIEAGRAAAAASQDARADGHDAANGSAPGGGV